MIHLTFPWLDFWCWADGFTNFLSAYRPVRSSPWIRFKTHPNKLNVSETRIGKHRIRSNIPLFSTELYQVKDDVERSNTYKDVAIIFLNRYTFSVQVFRHVMFSYVLEKKIENIEKKIRYGTRKYRFTLVLATDSQWMIWDG